MTSEPKRKRLGAFGWGVVLGFGGPLASLVVLYGVMVASDPGFRPEPFSVRVASSGADATAHGARQLLFEHDRSRIQQACNGPCDDLQLQENLPETGYRVRVLDGGGRCVACTDERYVTRGYGSPVLELTIAGSAVLDIRASYGSGAEAGSVKVGPPDRTATPTK